MFQISIEYFFLKKIKNVLLLLCVHLVTGERCVVSVGACVDLRTRLPAVRVAQLAHGCSL